AGQPTSTTVLRPPSRPAALAGTRGRQAPAAARSAVSPGSDEAAGWAEPPRARASSGCLESVFLEDRDPGVGGHIVHERRRAFGIGCVVDRDDGVIVNGLIGFGKVDSLHSPVRIAAFNVGPLNIGPLNIGPLKIRTSRGDVGVVY